MKRHIRIAVFESNSSSTHSIVIHENSKLLYNDIPKNSEIIIDDSYAYGTDIYDEVGKLNFMVKMLATIAENEADDESEEWNWEMPFKNFINHDWFKWLAEVVKDESNTIVKYICPLNYCGVEMSFPFYDTTYDEYDTVKYILTGGNYAILTNEKLFKELMKHIIYSKDVRIEDKENEY